MTGTALPSRHMSVLMWKPNAINNYIPVVDGL
jgi:hypothetical protein